jgi:cytochrome c oxidase assembly protein subunit 11
MMNYQSSSRFLTTVPQSKQYNPFPTPHSNLKPIRSKPNSRSFTSQTTPTPPHQPVETVKPSQPSTSPTPPPPPPPTAEPTQIPPTPTTDAAASQTAVNQAKTTQTRAVYLDRRDNVHSYESGQFHVETGKRLSDKNTNWLYYLTAMGFASLGMSFVAVPLYQAFCQMTGSGGQVRRDQQIDELNRYMQRTHDLGDVTLRPIEVTFQSTVDINLDWSFYPCQKDITLRIGETALAFFRARNNGDKPVIGVSTYNVLPPQAGLYFNKIQCFCFDEQRLRAGEEVDMPVFFFLDPAMADDWRMDNVDQITLCYTFFEVQEDQVEEAVQGLNEVRSKNNDRIAATGMVAVPTGDITIPTDREYKTYTHTMTINVVEPKTIDISTDHAKPTAMNEEAMICPIIPPTATHNPSGISLMQSPQPRIVSDEEAKRNEASVTQ